jgi:hypothetical protein
MLAAAEGKDLDAPQDTELLELLMQTVSMRDVLECCQQVQTEAARRVITPDAAVRRVQTLLEWRAAKR